MHRRARTLALPLPILLLASCAWLHDRAADLADVFVLEGSLGVGLSADVKATDLLHLGVGYAHGRKVSVRGRDVAWLRDREVGLPFSAILWGGALRDGQLWRLGHLHTNSAELWHGAAPSRIADVEVGVFLGFVGLRLGFSPGELLDFVAGLVGFDPSGDDAGLRREPAPDEPQEEGRWLKGDLHAHCDPPDGGHAPVSPEATHALAAANGLDFVGINPHLWLRGTPPREREDLRAFAARVRALEGTGPLLIPGMEVMLRGRRGPLGPSGHVLFLFRDPAEAYAFDHPAADERDWVRERLASVPPARRLWAPTHPWPHPRLKIPFFPDHAAPWKQLEELPQGEALLAGRRHALWATAWREREERDGARVRWRLARYRLDPAAREALPLLPPIATREAVALRWPRGLAPVGGDGDLAGGGAPDLVAALTVAIRSATPASLLAAESAAEVRRSQAALADALARALQGGVPQGRFELEVALDVGRNAWAWGQIARRPDAPDELTLSWGATPPGPDGAPLPALHDVPIDGLETLSGLVHLAALAVGRRGDELDRGQVFAQLERRMLAERRRLVPLAGSDNHRDMLFPTLWAFARDRSREAVFDALREGRVCVGGPETTSLRARTDRDPVWRAVGAAPLADGWVELRWRGEAELFVNGRSLGAFRGGFRHAIEPGALHIYRIVRGPSWSGWIYVNLPEVSAAARDRSG